MNNIKVLVVDDMQEICDYFSMIINRESGMNVIATAKSAKEAITAAEKYKPDIIMLDIQMETENAGIQATKSIKEKHPEIKIIIVSIHDNDDNILQAFMAGADDYVIKTASIVDILSVIREVTDNSSSKNHVKQKIITNMIRLKHEQMSMMYTLNLITKLTKSEYEVLKMAYNGESYKEIARQRFVEEATIRSLVNKILKKLEAKSMKKLISDLKKLNILDKLD